VSEKGGSYLLTVKIIMVLKESFIIKTVDRIDYRYRLVHLWVSAMMLNV
jgi:hypothetical protein